MLFKCKSGAFESVKAQSPTARGIRARERRKPIIGIFHLIFNSKRKERNFKTTVATSQFKKYH